MICTNTHKQSLSLHLRVGDGGVGPGGGGIGPPMGLHLSPGLKKQNPASTPTAAVHLHR